MVRSNPHASRAPRRSRAGGVGAQVTALPNGLRVVTDAIPGLETTSIGVWVDTGSRNEDPEINGVSHLLEHMAFKGTERRSARAIAEEVEAVGGHLNAYTSSEQTAYLARVLKDMFRSLTPADDLVFRAGTDSPTVRIEGMTVAGA